MKLRTLSLSLLSLLTFGGPARADGQVKVFILAGQSNMEGKAQNKLLNYQAVDQKTAAAFRHLRKNEEWVTRDDVFIKYLGRHGGLTVGYGSRDRTGVELELGHVLGDAYDEKVLLSKTAWGGHSLFKLFRPPSSGMPEKRIEAEYEKALEKAKKDNVGSDRPTPPPSLADIRANYGLSYRNMLKEVASTLSNMDTLFPELEGLSPHIAGFVWFQGWNDQYEGAETEYASNMEHFIKDVRRDLQAPKMPFVIGVMGQNMSAPAKGPMLVIQNAQLSMQKLPAFVGNVRSVRTDTLVDKAAEALYPTWRDNIEEWEKVGSDHPYHYLGSALWFNRMGRAFGEALLEISD